MLAYVCIHGVEEPYGSSNLPYKAGRAENLYAQSKIALSIQVSPRWDFFWIPDYQ